MNMHVKGITLLSPNPMTLLRAAAAALLGTAALADATPVSTAGTYTHAALGYPGASNHDGYTLGENDSLGGVWTGTFYDGGGAAQFALSVSGNRAAYDPGFNQSLTYNVPANTSLNHASMRVNVHALNSGDWN